MANTAVLVIDMLNTYEHPDANLLAVSVEGIVDPLAELLSHVGTSEDADLIYVNDNYGDFGATSADLVQAALRGKRPDLVKPIVPEPDQRFLTKVRHSAFYSTALGYLLGRLGTTRIVLTGQVTEQCILYTALDGYVRHFDVVVPQDAVAHIDPRLGEAALAMMERNMGATVTTSRDCL